MKQWLIYQQPPRRGTDHIKEERPNQDCSAALETEGRLIGVLADGLSGMFYSIVASRAATMSLPDYLSSYSFDGKDPEEIGKDILHFVRQNIEEMCAKYHVPAEEADCTLLFAVLEKKQQKLIYGQLGDGAVCLFKEAEGELIELPKSTRRSIANQTKTVFSNDALESFVIKEANCKEYSGILLCSDGLKYEIYSSVCGVKRQAEWYLNQMEKEGREKAINERWDALAQNTVFHDDMSLVILKKKGAQIQLPDDTTWLCECSLRIPLEITRCPHCGREIFRVYPGIHFSELPGGARQFFRKLNEDPKREQAFLLHQTENGEEKLSDPKEEIMEPVDNKEREDGKASAPVHSIPLAVYLLSIIFLFVVFLNAWNESALRVSCPVTIQSQASHSVYSIQLKSGQKNGQMLQ